MHVSSENFCAASNSVSAYEAAAEHVSISGKIPSSFEIENGRPRKLRPTGLYRRLWLLFLQCTTCPNMHELTELTTPFPGFGCNACGATLPAGSLMYGCRRCNFDQCDKCYNDRVTVYFQTSSPLILWHRNILLSKLTARICRCGVFWIFHLKNVENDTELINVLEQNTHPDVWSSDTISINTSATMTGCTFAGKNGGLLHPLWNRFRKHCFV